MIISHLLMPIHYFSGISAINSFEHQNILTSLSVITDIGNSLLMFDLHLVEVVSQQHIYV